MRQWYPEARDEGLDEVYRHLPPPGERWVAINMVASVDGAIDVDGTSGDLGGEGDLAAFRALRAAVDVVLVGAGTARAEEYGPPRVAEDLRAVRRDRGQSERPAVAIVTRSLDLSGSERLLEADVPVYVLTSGSASADRRADLEERGVVVVVVGEDEVDLEAGIERLAEDGLGRVLCEGGPSLNRDLLDAALVDDLFLTVAPVLVGGEGRIVAGELPLVRGLTLREGRVHGGELLLRYAVD